MQSPNIHFGNNGDNPGYTELNSVFKTFRTAQKNKYLEELETEEDYADLYGPFTYDEKLEFFLRRHFVIPVLAAAAAIIKIFDIKRRK